MRKFLFGTGILSLTGLVFLLAVGCGSDDDGGSLPTPCSIDVYGPTFRDIITTPATDETPETDRVDIDWEAAGGGNVMIELLKGGDLLGVLHEEVANTGYNWWYVDDLVTNSGEDYQVRVTHLTSSECGDTSSMFTIRDLRACGIDVTIVYPNMRTNPAEAGDVMTIDWVPTSTTERYDVELWQDSVGDFLVGTIAEDLTGDEVVGGWVIDSFHVGSSWYFIKVQDREIDSCFGRSETFEMNDEVVCEIILVTPASSGPYPEGSLLEITWTAENTTGLLDIELYYGEQDRIAVIATDVEAADGAYWWTVDDFNYPGESTSNYKFKITDHDDSYCFTFGSNLSIPR